MQRFFFVLHKTHPDFCATHGYPCRRERRRKTPLPDGPGRITPSTRPSGQKTSPAANEEPAGLFTRRRRQDRRAAKDRQNFSKTFSSNPFALKKVRIFAVALEKALFARILFIFSLKDLTMKIVRRRQAFSPAHDTRPRERIFREKTHIEPMKGLIQYIKDSWNELFGGKVTWPTWSEAQRQTWIVAIATLILAGATALVDSVFNSAIQGIFKLLN